MDIETLQQQLEEHGQSHVLAFWDQLDSAGQQKLASQLADIDFHQLGRLVKSEDEKCDFAAMARRSQSPPAVKADGSGANWSRQDAIERGEEALSAGEVAAVIVAGGQGTRLGFDKPKGMFPIGPVSDRTLFQLFADRLNAIKSRYGNPVPLYLMTSPATHQETLDYLESTNSLGLDPETVRIFCQGTMPAVDAASGELLLAAKDSLALSPDGHGGTVAALKNSGTLHHAMDRGVRLLSYAQVDNPLVPLADAELLGHHLLAESELTTLVVRKRYPTERVGNIVMVDDAVQIIEYSDLPEEVAVMTNPDGSLKLWAGNVGVHVFDLEFVNRVANDVESLPFHRANKKVPFVDETGALVAPDSPNAVKFERFIFDLLPAAKNAFVVEGLPSEIFAPVKNADGAENDTPALAKKAISDLHSKWLRDAGVDVGPDVLVEIQAELAMDAGLVRKNLGEHPAIQQDTYLKSS